MKRNASIELYRIVLMFGICLLHASIVQGRSVPWFINCTPFCVDGFVFITGYFGCTFTPSKLVRLITAGLICATIAALGDLRLAWTYFGNYWFLHAYVLMMVLAPFTDALISSADGRKLSAILPFLALVFVWGFAPTLPYLSRMNLPTTPGLVPYSGLTLLGVYIVGRYVRRFEILEKVNPLFVLMCSVGLFVLSAIGLCEYNSPVSVALAACLFALFMRIRLPNGLSRVVFLIAPSAFSIYLLHQARLDLVFLWTNKLLDLGWSYYAACFVVASITFVISLAFDLPRRVVGVLLLPWLKRFYDLLDRWYFGGCAWLEGRLPKG